ncbi:MAG: thioredoxin domain-containing protein [Deltaproteobacteria bacterium]|nr:thioredoxin domain-containing protein [Deltaproteobacteria bacterium]
MKPGAWTGGAVVAGYFVVAAAFFLLGRLTATGPGAPSGPAHAVEPAPAAAPVPAAKPAAPAPSPAPAQQLRIDDLRVGAPTPPPSASTVVIPPGTKPAADASPAQGPATALVIVNEVSDFQCPVCRRAWDPLKQLAKEYPGKVRLVFKQHPLEMHRNAMNAAAASMAAARQGKFWEYSDILFQNQQALSEADLLKHASQLGLNAERFDRDYRDPALRARAKAEGEAAMALGAQGTPSFFVNGRREVGWASYEAVKQQVEQEIAAVEAQMAGGKSLKEARAARVRANLPEGADAYLSGPLGAEFGQP